MLSGVLASLNPAQNTGGSQFNNILLFVGDDIGVDNVSAYGEHSQSAITPTIDDLANRGIMFRNAWANQQCSPTRASVLTGRYSFRHGVTSPGGATGTLNDSEVTIAELLSDAGYQTALFGKWHLGTGNESLPTAQGFDHFSGGLNSAVEDYFAWQKVVVTSQGGTPTTINETDYATEVVAEESVDWINNTDDRPWFAMVSFNAPHGPFHVPPNNRYSNVTLNGPVGASCGNGDVDSDDLCYRAMIEAMDSYMSDILAQISPEKLAQTLIIFLGDNGTPNATVIAEDSFQRGRAKGTVYEGGVNVPLIINASDDVNINIAEIPDLVQIQDVFSTIAHVAGVQNPSNVQIDGRSLLGYVQTTIPAPTPRQTQFTFATQDLQWAHSNGVDKYILIDDGEECYNLINDPGELNPNSGDQATCNLLRDTRPQ